MKIDNIKLNTFRNYENANISLKDGINFIVGKNAQGKTNLLESVYLLSVGKSPKNSKDKQIIKFGADKSRVEINFSTREGNKTIQMLLDRFNKKSIRINNLNVLKIAELVGVLSVVYFSPDELKLIKEVPEDRRRFLDVSISQFDKAYLYDIIKYDKILKQRNTILKSNSSKETKVEELKLFTPQLIDTAEQIIIKRVKFIENLKNIAKNIHKIITNSENLEIFYSFDISTKSIKEQLNELFEKNIDKELELGYTCFGPHRDDIIFKINDLDCKYYASQGQQRTVALVVKLALMEVIKSHIGEYPILLLDDVLSELDYSRQNKMLELTKKYQTFITCTSIPILDFEYNKIEIENGQVVTQ